MWHINNITADNFISFQHLDLDLPQDSCSLIYGQNLDNDKQKNNGTGKSTIVEAIAYAITGESMRGVRDAELINDHSDTATIELTLENDFDDSLFVITRTLDRKNPQRIECHKYDADDNEIEVDKTVQATVLDYNRYILDEIGVSKDDLYNNYILSNARYESFFNASDKNKKAMINRFSGADAVDRSIAALKADMEPLETELRQVRDKKIAVQAKIDAVNEQIKDAESKKEEYLVNKQRRIADIEQRIADKREQLRSTQVQTKEYSERLTELKELANGISDIEDNSNGLEADYTDIQMLFEQAGLKALKNYVEESKTTLSNIDDYITQKAALTKDIESAEKALNNLKKCHADASATAQAFEKAKKTADNDDMLDIADIDKEIGDVQKSIASLEIEHKRNSQLSDALNRKIRNLNNILHGVITCPKCSHRFFLSEERSVDEIQEDLKQANKEYTNATLTCESLEKQSKDLADNKESLEKERAEIKADMDEREADYQKALSKVRAALHDVEEGYSGIDSIQNRIKRLENSVETCRAKLENISQTMFEEAESIISSNIRQVQTSITISNDELIAIESAISTFAASKQEAEQGSADDLITSMNNSKAGYEKELNVVEKELAEVQSEYDKYTLQEAHFTQFKSHLANKKIDAIAAVTNSFLSKIGSDLRVELLGYKVLRTGKLRDKITVNLLRGGVPCGSYARHSGGEKARVNLASILALQKLTNNACAQGKGLDLVALDEILEASDSIGIESCCQALNILKVSSLLVTQNPIINHDGGEIVVVKENGFSRIKED